MSDAGRKFLQPMSIAEVSRSLPPALLWAYVALVIGVIILVAVGLAAYVVLGVMWLFDRSRDVTEPAWQAVATGAWFTAPVALGAAVWGAAYASTTARSLPRSLIGTIAAVLVGAGLLLLQASGFAVAALALGWAIAIPAHSVGRIGARGVLPIAFAVIALGWSWGSLEGYELWQLIALVVASPLIAGLWVWLADALWTAAAAARGQPDG